MPGKNRYPNVTDHPGIDPFVHAIAASPHDDLPKMVFADWLDENGYENAAHGMRFAGRYHKRPSDPREMASYYNGVHRRSGMNDDMHPDDTMSGWLTPGVHASSPHDDHRIPETLWWAHGNMGLSHFNKTPDERMREHWKDYLSASENSKFDEDGHPLSRYGPDHPLHNTDTAFPS